jgi:hypothetical protein
MPPVIVAFGFAPIVRSGRSTVPAHSYVQVIGLSALTLHEVIKTVAYKWTPAWEDVLSGRWQVWQTRTFVDMSQVAEPLAFMTYPGALCITEPGRLHVPLQVAPRETSPGYTTARDAALARLPSSTHIPPEAVMLSLYFYMDEPVRCNECYFVTLLTMRTDFGCTNSQSLCAAWSCRGSLDTHSLLSFGWSRHSRDGTYV